MSTPLIDTDPGEPAIEIKPWDHVGSLVQAKFGELISDLKDLENEKKDIEERIERTRALIAPLVKDLPFAVDALDKRIRWAQGSFRLQLDAGLLVRAGVTPDQLEAGKKTVPVKAHLKIGPIGQKEG